MHNKPLPISFFVHVWLLGQRPLKAGRLKARTRIGKGRTNFEFLGIQRTIETGSREEAGAWLRNGSDITIQQYLHLCEDHFIKSFITLTVKP